MRLRRGNRGASSRMTSSVYRPLCSFGFAFRGGRFSVPPEVIRSGGDGLRCALRNGLRPSTRTSYFISSSARTRSASGPLARHATSTASRATRRSARTPSMPSPPNSPLIAFRVTPRARSACTAQRETDHEEGASEAPGFPPKGWTLREVGGDAKRCAVRSTSRRTDTATTTRRGALRSPKSEVRSPSGRAQSVAKSEVRAVAAPRPAPTHEVRNAWPRGSTEHEEVTG